MNVTATGRELRDAGLLDRYCQAVGISCADMRPRDDESVTLPPQVAVELLQSLRNPPTPEPLTVARVETTVHKIAAVVDDGDDERAANLEHALWRDVLTAIATDTLHMNDAAALARAALATTQQESTR